VSSILGKTFSNLITQHGKFEVNVLFNAKSCAVCDRKACRVIEVQLHTFLTLALNGGDGNPFKILTFVKGPPVGLLVFISVFVPFTLISIRNVSYILISSSF
jgi:hypothetical protein